MVNFRSKKIYFDDQTVAEQLRSTRQKKKLDLAEIASELKVNIKYLQALEKGEYEKLPPGFYTLNALKQYGRYLGLNVKKLANQFHEEQEVYRSDKQDKLFVKETVSSKWFVSTPRLIKGIILVAIVAVVGAYLFILIKNFYSPPMLVVYSPPKDYITNEDEVLVVGQTEPETEILINDEPAIVDDQGNFTERVDIKNGINRITIKANKGAKRQSLVIREILQKNSQN